ncbi:hypothetical protein B0H34DRAFT_697205 [Crassisporium funariophilum]|nr:hypothetical protein B0H34DRAFT_697205 [Crassisporium funariophilum]
MACLICRLTFLRGLSLPLVVPLHYLVPLVFLDFRLDRFPSLYPYFFIHLIVAHISTRHITTGLLLLHMAFAHCSRYVETTSVLCYRSFAHSTPRI